MQKNEYLKKNTHLGPKRRIQHRLGPFLSLLPSFALPVVYSIDYNLYTYVKH